MAPGAGSYWEAQRARQEAINAHNRANQARGPARETPPTLAAPLPVQPRRKAIDPVVDPKGFWTGPPDHRRWASTERDGGLARMVRKLGRPAMKSPGYGRTFEPMHTTAATALVQPRKELVTSGRRHHQGPDPANLVPALPKAGAKAAAEHLEDLMLTEAKQEKQREQARERQKRRYWRKKEQA